MRFIFTIIFLSFFFFSYGQDFYDSILLKTNYIKFDDFKKISNTEKKTISNYFNRKLNLDIKKYYVLNISLDSLKKSIPFSFMTIDALKEYYSNIKKGSFLIGCCYGKNEYDDFILIYDFKRKKIIGLSKRE